MHNETEGKLTLKLIPTSKVPYTGLVYRKDRWPDLTLKGCSNREESILHQDEKMTTSAVDGLLKMLDLIHMIIYNVFLTHSEEFSTLEKRNQWSLNTSGPQGKCNLQLSLGKISACQPSEVKNNKNNQTQDPLVQNTAAFN